MVPGVAKCGTHGIILFRLLLLLSITLASSDWSCDTLPTLVEATGDECTNGETKAWLVSEGSQNFSRDGHMLVRGVFTDVELIPFHPHIARLVAAKGEVQQRPYRTKGRHPSSLARQLSVVHNAVGQSCAALKLLHSPRLLQAARAILVSNVVCIVS